MHIDPMQSLPTHSETTMLSTSHHGFPYSQQQNHHPATVIASDLSSIQGEHDDTDNDETASKPEKRSGRRNIKIEYIDDKSRRHITFSKRKAGIMKKAYELSTLTGTQILLLVVSETGLVYTFTTPKLQPLVTKQEGKNLIQACLNAPNDLLADTQSTPHLSASPTPTRNQSNTTTTMIKSESYSDAPIHHRNASDIYSGPQQQYPHDTSVIYSNRQLQHELETHSSTTSSNDHTFLMSGQYNQQDYQQHPFKTPSSAYPSSSYYPPFHPSSNLLHY